MPTPAPCRSGPSPSPRWRGRCWRRPRRGRTGWTRRRSTRRPGVSTPGARMPRPPAGLISSAPAAPRPRRWRARWPGHRTCAPGSGPRPPSRARGWCAPGTRRRGSPRRRTRRCRRWSPRRAGSSGSAPRWRPCPGPVRPPGRSPRPRRTPWSSACSAWSPPATNASAGCSTAPSRTPRVRCCPPHPSAPTSWNARKRRWPRPCRRPRRRFRSEPEMSVGLGLELGQRPGLELVLRRDLPQAREPRPAPGRAPVRSRARWPGRSAGSSTVP